MQTDTKERITAWNCNQLRTSPCCTALRVLCNWALLIACYFGQSGGKAIAVAAAVRLAYVCGPDMLTRPLSSKRSGSHLGGSCTASIHLARHVQCIGCSLQKPPAHLLFLNRQNRLSVTKVAGRFPPLYFVDTRSRAHAAPANRRKSWRTFWPLLESCNCSRFAGVAQSSQLPLANRGHSYDRDVRDQHPL